MKKSILTSFLFWLLIQTVLFSVFVFRGSGFALSIFICIALVSAVSFAGCFVGRKHISATVILTPTSKKSAEMKGSILLENKSFVPVIKAICELEAENRLTGEKSIITVGVSAFSNTVSEKDFSLFSKHCGYVTVSVKNIWLTDIFGFLPVKIRNFESSKAKAAVLPDTFAPIIVFDSIPPVPEDSDSYAPDKKGNDYSETFQIREYVPGDSIKQIHWKLSEKLDKTIIKEAGLPISKSTLLFWDKAAGEETLPEEMDAMAEVTASVAQSLCRMGMEFALGWGDGKASFMEEIRTTEDVIENIPRLIKFGAEKDSEVKTENFFENGFASGFGKIICIAKDIPSGAERASEESSVNLIICNKNVSGSNVVSFASETYIEDLSMLELTT